MKKLSIITSAYKSEKYLEVYFQNITGLNGFGDFQIILILNDANEKETEIADKYRSQYPENIEIVSVPRESIGASTNRGFKLAETELVTYADVDDYKKTDCYSRQIATLQSETKVDFTYGDFIMVSEQGSTDGVYVDTPEFTKDTATRGSIVGPNHFFRKKLLERCGYWDEQLKSGGDFDLQVRAALNADFKRTPGDALLYYTRYEGSGSASSNERQQIERTVIELRYGIYDKINYRYLPKALEYDIYHVYWGGQKYFVGDFVPNYRELLEDRYKKYFKNGLRRNIVDPAVVEKISAGLKYFSKKPLWVIRRMFK